MAIHGKKYNEKLALVDRTARYTFDEALALIRKSTLVGFDASLDVAINLGIDAKSGEQRVRGTVVLPYGTGRVPKVAVFAQGEAARAAQEAGADVVGADDLVAQIESGWADFDILVAHPDMMKSVGRLGRTLGPKMPNRKAGTVADDLGAAIAELKAGRLEFKNERAGIVHSVFGKLSFTDEQLTENFNALLDAIRRSKPATSKGRFIKAITISSSMSPGIKLDVSSFI